MRWSATKHQFAASGVWSQAGHTFALTAISLGAAVVSGGLTARLLGPWGKGGYDLIVTTAGLLSTALGGSLGAGITYYAARGELNVRKIVLGGGAWALLAGLASVACLMAWSQTPWFDLEATSLRNASTIAVIPVIVSVTIASDQWRSILVGVGRIEHANHCDATRELILVGSLAAMIVAYVATGRGVGYPTVAWVYAGTLVLAGWGLLRSAVSMAAIGPSRGAARMAGVVGYSARAHLANIIQFLNYRLDIFLVGAFLGLEGVGLYATAVAVSQVLWLASRSTARVLLPAVAAGHAEQRDTASLTVQMARVSIWAAAGGAFLLAISAQGLVRLVYGDSFSASVPVLIALLPGAVIFSMANILAAHLGGTGRLGPNLCASAMGFVTVAVLDVVLIPSAGIVGAGIARSIAYVAASAVLAVSFSRIEGTTLTRLVALKRDDVSAFRGILHGIGSFRLGRGAVSRQGATGG